MTQGRAAPHTPGGVMDKRLVVGLASFGLAYLVVGLGVLAVTTAAGWPVAWRELIGLDVVTAACAVGCGMIFGRLTWPWVLGLAVLLALDMRIATNFAVALMISGGECGDLNWASLVQPFVGARDAGFFGVQVLSPLAWLAVSAGAWRRLAARG